jgi:Putative restriction endonuclease
MAEYAMPMAILPLDGRSWPAQGEWTYEDYLRLPDDGRRYEVIRGRLYLAPLLNFAHQASLSRLMVQENLPQKGAKNFQGVPDLIVEIVSPNSRSYDRKIKLAAYQDAGVPEFWLVDPRSREVVIYGFGENGKRYIELDRGGMEDEVKSRVLPGFGMKVAELFR